MSEEHRRHARRGIDRNVQVELADGSTMRATLADVSEGGARLKTRSVAQLPQQFVLKLSNHLVRWARVIWRSGDEVGLEFVPQPRSAGELVRHAVLIKCPRTGKPMPTGMRLASGDDLARVAVVRRLSPCPYCKVAHGWMPGDAFLGLAPVGPAPSAQTTPLPSAAGR
jgi:hypothetical protein